MRLGILGSGTIVPFSERGAAGYVVEHQGKHLLLDCGPGSSRRWPKLGVDFGSVVGVMNTHHHADHVGDLGAILFGRNFAERSANDFLIAGPSGHRAFVEDLRALLGRGARDSTPPATLIELNDGESLPWQGFQVNAIAMHHPRRNPEDNRAIGYRITAGGRSLCFSGDTGPGPGVHRLCTGVDLALLECSYPASRQSKSHLTTSTVAEAAQTAGVRRLMLTHFYPEVLAGDPIAEVRAHGYTGELSLAEDLRWYDV